MIICGDRGGRGAAAGRPGISCSGCRRLGGSGCRLPSRAAACRVERGRCLARRAGSRDAARMPAAPSPQSASSPTPSARTSTPGTTTPAPSPGPRTPTRSSPRSDAQRLKQAPLHATSWRTIGPGSVIEIWEILFYLTELTHPSRVEERAAGWLAAILRCPGDELSLVQAGGGALAGGPRGGQEGHLVAVLQRDHRAVRVEGRPAPS